MLKIAEQVDGLCPWSFGNRPRLLGSVWVYPVEVWVIRKARIKRVNSKPSEWGRSFQPSI